MSKTYFITGAQGCIGSWIVKTLVERGDQAVVFDRSNDSRRLAAIMHAEDLAQVRFITGDITDGIAVRMALSHSEAQHLIHLAGLQVPTCRVDPIAGALVNVVGTLNVFEAAKTIGINHVVYASSAAVYELNDDDIALDENAHANPTTHYGVFKRTNEGNARIYFLDHGINSTGLRPLTVYGVNRDIGLTSDPTKAMKAAVLGRPFHIRFGGATDFQYVADTAAAFISCADNAPEGARQAGHARLRHGGPGRLCCHAGTQGSDPRLPIGGELMALAEGLRRTRFQDRLAMPSRRSCRWTSPCEKRTIDCCGAGRR